MTYLQAVNLVLQKLREDQITTVSAGSAYTQLIGVFCNEAKREIEDAWNWNCQRQTVAVTTSAGVQTYSLTGTNSRSRIRNVMNQTNRWVLKEATQMWMTEQFILASPPSGAPMWYTKNGQIDATQVMLVDLLPIPNSTPSTILFNMNIPPLDYVNDTDVIQIPSHLVVLGGYAKAVAERGEDDTAAQAAYNGAVQSAIARDVEDDAGEGDLIPV